MYLVLLGENELEEVRLRNGLRRAWAEVMCECQTGIRYPI